MTSDQTANQVGTHVAELGDGNEIENVELAGDSACGRTRNYVNDFRNEVVKPKHVEQSEYCIRHRPQRCVIAQAFEHLPSKNGEQEKEQHRHFKVVRVARADLR